MKEYERNRSDKPSRCKNCEYHQTRWKYRSCYFVRCPYGVKNIDSFLGGGQISFLTNEINGLDDFELICFLVIR